MKDLFEKLQGTPVASAGRVPSERKKPGTLMAGAITHVGDPAWLELFR